MNLLASWKHQPTDASAYLGDPLDLDSDFEEACRKEVEDLGRPPMQTDEERTIEAMEKLVTIYTDKDKAIDGEISAIEKQLSDKKAQKVANARLLSWATSALADLRDEVPAQPSKAKSRKAREVA